MDLSRVNWLDIGILILLGRIVYVAVENGLVSELFELLGLVLAVYLSFHYYSGLSGYMLKILGFTTASSSILNLLSFSLLAVLGYFILLFMRRLFVKFITAESAPEVHKWGGIIAGLLKGFLLSSIVVYAMAISGVTYLHKSVQNSYSGKYWMGVGCGLYSSLWDGFASKFMVSEKFNKNTVEVQMGALRPEDSKKK